MKETLKHLKILKEALAIEDKDIIDLKVKKLEAIQQDNKLQEILKYIRNNKRASALIKIKLYIDNNQKLEYGNYITSFVDILGQQQELTTIKDIIFGFGDTAKNSVLVKSTFSKTNEPIRRLRNTFQNEYHTYIRDDDIQKTNPELDFNPLQTSVFSDFVMNYISIKNTDKALSVQGAYFIIMSTGVVFLKMLAQGIKVRGGIDLGIGMEIDQNELYGAALLNSYELESKVAQYPRIVIGKNLIQYLEHYKKIKPDNKYDQLNQEFAKRCFRIITKDIDGKYIIDYLGNNFKEYYGRDLSEIIDKAYMALVKEYDSHIARGDSKLAFRYSLLRSYFEDRLNIKEI